MGHRKYDSKTPRRRRFLRKYQSGFRIAKSVPFATDGYVQLQQWLKYKKTIIMILMLKKAMIMKFVTVESSIGFFIIVYLLTYTEFALRFSGGEVR